MKRSIRIILAAAVIIIGAMDAMAIEEATYKVVKKDDKFEIRDYAPHTPAETVVEGALEEAGNKAFNILFRYISGYNRSRDKVAMTAPVSQEPIGEKIKMTAPVGQQRVQDRWAVSFMMPASYTLETLPEPEDTDVTFRQVPARRMAAVRCSGFGTTNYILTRMTPDNLPFEQALAEAQSQGYAEADPTLDVEGVDAAHKLAILMALAYGARRDFEAITVEGISRLEPLDLQFAKEFGYVIKLLAITRNDGNGLEARVHPTLIPRDHMLANVGGAMNAAYITGDAVGPILLYGRGAGMMPTASAVVSDLVLSFDTRMGDFGLNQ